MNDWNVLYSDEAERDLRDIYEYIAYSLLSPMNAEGQVERIMQAVERLDQMPYRHEKYPDEPWHSIGLRFMTVDNYCVLYLPDEFTMKVGIVRIMYDGRDKSSILRRN